MIHRKWPTALTHEEMVQRLSIACCALDKIAQWAGEDNLQLGDWRTFAQVAIEQVMAPGKDTTSHVGSTWRMWFRDNFGIKDSYYTDKIPDQIPDEGRMVRWLVHDWLKDKFAEPSIREFDCVSGKQGLPNEWEDCQGVIAWKYIDSSNGRNQGLAPRGANHE